MSAPLDKFRFALRNPSVFFGQANRLGTELNRRIHARLPDETGGDMMAEDWDTLVILDACRYDTFADCIRDVAIDGDLGSRRSPGSDTREFLAATFGEDSYHDTVYATANPWAINDLDPSQFHALYPLFDRGWDSDRKTIPPERMVEFTLSNFDTHPQKRWIVHFMQPHMPPIGDTGRELFDVGLAGFRDDQAVSDADSIGLWGKLRNGVDGVTVERVRSAYRESLEITLNEVTRLVDSLDGRTVITADHGELLGERLWPIPVRGYGHLGDIRTETLNRVPWFVVSGNERRKITVDDPITVTTTDSETINDRLRDLGYK